MLNFPFWLRTGATGVDAIMKGWYSELSEMWPGQAMSLKVDEVLYSGKSDFQDVLVRTTALRLIEILHGRTMRLLASGFPILQLRPRSGPRRRDPSHATRRVLVPGKPATVLSHILRTNRAIHPLVYSLPPAFSGLTLTCRARCTGDDGPCAALRSRRARQARPRGALTLLERLPRSAATRGPLTLSTSLAQVGGGDGGVVREVARHADVQSVECVDIDKMVPEMSRRFFPEVAVGFEARPRQHSLRNLASSPL